MTTSPTKPASTEKERAQRAQQQRIAIRLKLLREERSLTQDTLAKAMGFNDRQTLAAIEANQRRLQPTELLRAAEALGVSPELFSDPYRLVGEGEFSFRADADPKQLADFQERAGRWLATYRELGRRTGVSREPMANKLNITVQSSFEDVQEVAESLVARWDLGAVPAERLEAAIHEQLGVLVLYVDAPDSISGAATRLSDFSAILVNRLQPAARRYYNLAHELFHILTWDAMPPKKLEPLEVTKKKGNRVEQLAENFAAALLMPSAIVASHVAERAKIALPAWLRRTASILRVSTQALGYRLVNLQHATLTEVRAAWNELNKQAALLAGQPQADLPPKRFSQAFIGRILAGIERGFLSFGRATDLLVVDAETLDEICSEHGLTLPYSMA